MKSGVRALVSIFVPAGTIGLFACNAIIGTKDYVRASPDAALADESPGVGSDAASSHEDGDVPSACGDTDSSPLNCGRCGHDCLGGECDAGKCQPIVLHAGGAPRSIAVDADHVYWSDSTHALVARIDKDGSNYLELAKGGPGNQLPFGIAVDDKNVYWSIDSTIVRCATAGCANTPTIVTSTESFRDLLIDGDTLFWVDGDSGFSAQTYLRAISKDATNGTGGTILVGPEAELFRLTKDATNLYVTCSQASGGGSVLRRVSKSGGNVDIVARALGADGDLWGLAVDDSNVYFTDWGMGMIDVASKTAVDATPTVFAARQFSPVGIIVDGGNVYWLNAGAGAGVADGTLMSCPIASCTTPTVVADHLRSPLTITVDEHAIYWANFDLGNENGGVLKIAKP